MGADELAYWLAYEAEFGLPDGFFVAGQVCTLVARLMGNSAGPEDFVPYYGRPEPEAMSPAEIKARFARARESLAAFKRTPRAPHQG